MKAERKNTLMIWAIVVLALMNISTLATILYHQYQSKQIVVSKQNQLETDVEKFSGRYFRDKLNLNSSQMDDFRQFNRSFRRQAKAITIELTEQRIAMLKEMSALQSDTSKLNDYSDSIGMLHAQLKKITYQYYLDIKNVCSSEQQKNLEQLFSDMFTNDASMSYPGPGHGRMKGRHFRDKSNN